jgi:hypothetical protein
MRGWPPGGWHRLAMGRCSRMHPEKGQHKRRCLLEHAGRLLRPMSFGCPSRHGAAGVPPLHLQHACVVAAVQVGRLR